ncbi:MAG: hypothetical protein ABIO70_24235 [Pseudomonadota bacterium]
MLRLALFLSLLTPPTFAGTRLLQNDGFTGEGEVGFQGGFVDGECWGVVYVPQATDYPFNLAYADTLVGGSSGSEFFGIDVYQVTTSSMSGTLLGSGAVQITGSQESFSRIDFSEAIEDVLPSIDSGNVAVSVCLDGFGGYPAIARDTDGMAHADRNWVYAGVGGGAYSWFQSNQFGLTGDWIQRLCIEGANISGDGCEGDADADGDADGDTDTDSDADADPGSFWVESITPDHADPGVPIDVYIKGGGFAEGIGAYIGGLAVSGIEVLDENTLEGRTPSALPEGVHDVEVQLGGENDLIEAAFTVGGCGGCSAGGGVGGLLLLIPGITWVGSRARRHRRG